MSFKKEVFNKKFMLNFGKNDEKLYKYFSTKKHKSDYIRELIEADMKESKKRKR